MLLTDLGSANGTYLNDRRVAQADPVALTKEDMLRIGNSILKFLPAGELEIIFYGNLGAAAHTDALTRIYNKGYLLEALDAEFKRAKALHTDFSLIFFDLDHFKRINDTFGHDAGDYVLKEIARLIRDRISPAQGHLRAVRRRRIRDPARQPRTARHAADLAERIRAAVEAHAFLYEGKRLPVTCSMGVADARARRSSRRTALLRAADKAGYASKQNGRNRVTRRRLTRRPATRRSPTCAGAVQLPTRWPE